jgi:photosystem II stability/assembly factor-like uncharacterized protein
MMRPSSRCAAAVMLGVLFFGFAGCRSDGDRLEVPTPDENTYVAMRLTCLNATAPEHVVVAGYLSRVDGRVEGVVLRTETGGDTWQRVGSETFNFESFILQCLHYNDALRGWAAGVRTVDGVTYPTVIRTSDGGGHWRESLVPHPRGELVSDLADLAFENDATGQVTVHFIGSTGEMLANVYQTNDGGANWVIKDFEDPSSKGPTDPAEIFVSDTQGFRLDPPLANGTQVLQFTGTKGKSWVPRCQFHVSQLLSYY